MADSQIGAGVGMLDRLIRETEQKLEEAKRAADSIPALSNDLLALQRSRALATGNANGNGQGGSLTRKIEMESPFPVRAAGSIPQTEMVLDILWTAGRPMLVKDIMATIRERVPDAKEPTIVSHLSRFVERKKVRRTAPSTYEIAATEPRRTTTAQDLRDQGRSA